jgi:DNA-directed RNA polymerase subunit N (RpoN/RPB10)
VCGVGDKWEIYGERVRRKSMMKDVLEERATKGEKVVVVIDELGT